MPEMISESPLARIWFKQDDEFKLPKSVVYAELFRYVIYMLVVSVLCSAQLALLRLVPGPSLVTQPSLLLTIQLLIKLSFKNF